MKVSYVLDRPEPSGLVRVVQQHARWLSAAGHEVVILGYGAAPTWFTGVTYRDYEPGRPALPAQDVVIATCWVTLDSARELDLGPVVHFCQGYEGEMAHLRPVWNAVDAAYTRQRVPTLVVGEPLGAFLADRFGRVSRVVPPGVDPAIQPAAFRFGPRSRPWVGAPGYFGNEAHGVATALDVLERLRARGVSCRLLRWSPVAATAEERTKFPAERFLVAPSPAEIFRELAGLDLLLYPARAPEAFGLPVLDALAAKVPVVASKIPALEAWVGGAVPLVPATDADAFAREAAAILGSRERWNKARAAGFESSRRFLPQRLGPQLADAVAWARETAAPTRKR